MPQFLIHFSAGGHGLSNFCPQEFAVSLTQSMHGAFDRAFSHAEFFGDLVVGSRGVLAPNAAFEHLENLEFVRRGELLLQAGYGRFEHAHSPSLLKKLVRSQILGRFGQITVLGLPFVPGNNRARPAPFGRARLVPFVDQKVIERPDQKCAKFAPALVRQPEVLVFQKAGEEFLGQILRVRRGVTLSPNENIKRVPIRLAKSLQRRRGIERIDLPSLENDAPVRGDKAARRRLS